MCFTLQLKVTFATMLGEKKSNTSSRFRCS